MSIRIFKLSHSETYWDGAVEIDTGNVAATEAMKETVEFWSDWQYRLNENGGDYVRTFLKMLGQKLVLMQLGFGYNLSGIIKEMAKEEGWPPLDGTYGITLVRCDDAEISEDDIFISE